MNRLSQLVFVSVLLASLLALQASAATAKAAKPNFIIVFTDDQGYGDLGCYGSKTIQTPRLDTLAREGLRLTSFYVQPVCGPSRAALLTGCYAARVIRSWSLAPEEITLAEVLKPAGYATACIGKWDLSGRRFVEGRHPTDQGFDYYFGTLGATDSGHVKFYRNKEPAGETSDMGSLTKTFTDEAIKFIQQHKDEPFFVYLPHSMPHIKIGASEQFRGKSKGDLYGDVIEEIDWNVGRLIDALKDLKREKNTIVLFTSDNGPWIGAEARARQSHGGHQATGSAGSLRGSKGSAWEGGFRVPAIVWGPGQIKGGRENAGIVGSIDLLPTFASLAGATVPTDRVIDGRDQSALFTGRSNQSVRDEFLFYGGGNLAAVRHGRWKLFCGKNAALYDLEADIGEQHDVQADHPEVVKQLQALADRARADIGDGNKLGKNSRCQEQPAKPKKTPKAGQKPKQ